jgi:hypothetical protein
VGELPAAAPERRAWIQTAARAMRPWATGTWMTHSTTLLPTGPTALRAAQSLVV